MYHVPKSQPPTPPKKYAGFFWLPVPLISLGICGWLFIELFGYGFRLRDLQEFRILIFTLALSFGVVGAIIDIALIAVKRPRRPLLILNVALLVNIPIIFILLYVFCIGCSS